MRRLALIFIVSTAAAIGAAVAFAATNQTVPGVTGTVWVADRFDAGANSLAAIDAGTGRVIAMRRVGSRPIAVLTPNGTGKVYTADERSNQLTVFTTASFATPNARARQIPVGPSPHHMIASPDGKRIYVGEYGSHKIGVVDTTLDARIDGFYASGNPLAKTHAVAVSADGKTLYAANEGPTSSSWGTVSKLDATTGERVWEIPLGIRPSEVLVTPDGKTLYATVRNENAVRVFDVSGTRPSLSRTVTIGTQPDTMQLTNDGKTLVVGLRGTPQMALMDTATFAVRQVTFTGYGISGHQWLNASGKYTFIALEASSTDKAGAVAVVDNDSAAIVATWPLPTGPQPHGLAYDTGVLH